MTARITKPQQAFTVTTYDELHRFVRAFADGHLNLLILIGAACIAKSQTVKKSDIEAAPRTSTRTSSSRVVRRAARLKTV